MARLLCATAEYRVDSKTMSFEPALEKAAEKTAKKSDASVFRANQNDHAKRLKPDMLQRQIGNYQGTLENKRAPTIVNEVLRGLGQPLDSDTRALMESRFRFDFSQVRVHADARAANSARAVNALAYTVGKDVVFGGSFVSGTSEGRRLMAHELTHVLQQGKGDGIVQGQQKLTVNEPGDVYEQEANAAATHFSSGGQAGESFMSSELSVQRQTPGGAGAKSGEKKEAPDAMVEGVKTVVDQLLSNNEKVKKQVVEPAKKEAESEFGSLSTGEKALAAGFGAGTLALGYGAMLSDPGGRKQLSGLNLAAPLGLIPHMPLTNFSFTQDKSKYKFQTSFKGDDLINLITAPAGLPKMSLTANVQYGYDEATGHFAIAGGDATIGILPGLSVSAGYYKDILRQPRTFMGAAGEMVIEKKSVPEIGKPTAIPDARVMVTFDLMKFINR